MNLLSKLFLAVCLLLPLAAPMRAGAQEPRTLEVAGSRNFSPGAIIKHPVANALRLTIKPEAGLSVAGATRLVAQIRNSATDATTPMASTDLVSLTGPGPYVIDFTAAQMNQDLQGKPQRDVWLVVFAVPASGGVDVWFTGSLRLTAHGASLNTATPPVPVDLLTEAEATTLYASLSDMTALAGRVAPAGTNLFPESFGAVGDMATDDTAAVQAAVNAAIASKGQVLLSKFYRITDTITVSGTCPIIGTGVRALWGSRSLTKSDVIPSVAPYLTGSGLYMTAANKTAIHLTGIGGSVHLKDFGIRFADAIRWADTGHGVHIDPPVYLTYKNSGPYNGEISGVFIYGHDGDHYAFNFVNTQLLSMTNCQGYGGGGLRWETDCLISYKGNSTISQTYFMLCAGGTAHGYHLVTTKAGHGSVLNVFIRPQCITDNQIPDVPVPVQSGQKAWLMDSGSDHTAIIAPDFESTSGLSNNAAEYNLSTNVGVRLISGGVGMANNNAEHLDASLDIGQPFDAGNPIYKSLTIRGQNGGRLRMGDSVTGEDFSVLAQPANGQQIYARGGLDVNPIGGPARLQLPGSGGSFGTPSTLGFSGLSAGNILSMGDANHWLRAQSGKRMAVAGYGGIDFYTNHQGTLPTALLDVGSASDSAVKVHGLLEAVNTRVTTGLAVGSVLPGVVVGGQVSTLATSGFSSLNGLRVNGADQTNTLYLPSGNMGITTNGGTLSLGAATSAAHLTISGSGAVGIPGALTLGGLRLATATPASATAAGTAGEICWDANYLYVCTATNTWKRTAIATW